jgi:hypothetical protein
MVRQRLIQVSIQEEISPRMDVKSLASVHKDKLCCSLEVPQHNFGTRLKFNL